MLDEFCSKYYLCYEYEQNEYYPINYQSGLDLLNKNNTNKILTENKKKGNPKNPSFLKQSSIRTSNYYGNKGLRIGELSYNKETRKYIFSNENPDDYKEFNNLFDAYIELHKYINPTYFFHKFSWQEFELFISDALSYYGYFSFKTFRFSLNKKRYEIDIVARNGRDILLIDAKRWKPKTTTQSALYNVIEKQIIRVKSLQKIPEAIGEILERLKAPPIRPNKPYFAYPIVITSANLNQLQFINGAVLLSFSQLNLFLNNFTAFKPKLTKYRLTHSIRQKKIL